MEIVRTMRSWTDAQWKVVSSTGPKVELHHDRLAWPLLAGTGRRILVGGGADLFNEQVPLEFLAGIFGVMALARQHTFQVLTRYPQRLALFLGWLDRHCGWLPMRMCHLSLCQAALDKHGIDTTRFPAPSRPAWPLPNVWLGLLAAVRELPCRLPRLLEAPAALRWLYLEQAAHPIDLTQLDATRFGAQFSRDTVLGSERLRGASLNALTGCIRHAQGAMVTTVGRLGWVVADARYGTEAARSLGDQCRLARVPVYFTGDGRRGLPREMPTRGRDGATLERRQWNERPSAA